MTGSGELDSEAELQELEPQPGTVYEIRNANGNNYFEAISGADKGQKLLLLRGQTIVVTPDFSAAQGRKADALKIQYKHATHATLEIGNNKPSMIFYRNAVEPILATPTNQIGSVKLRNLPPGVRVTIIKSRLTEIALKAQAHRALQSQQTAVAAVSV